MELSIWDTLSDVDVTKCNLLKIIKERRVSFIQNL